MDHVYLFHKSLHTGRDTAVLIHLYSQDIVSFFFLNFHREPHWSARMKMNGFYTAICKCDDKVPSTAAE